MLKCIELKSGYGDSGPAWIARTKASRSGTTIYFNGMALKKIKRGGGSGNYSDLATGKEYWISGVKKRGLNRHQFRSGTISVEQSVVKEFLEITGNQQLDKKAFTICPD